MGFKPDRFRVKQGRKKNGLKEAQDLTPAPYDR